MKKLLAVLLLVSPLLFAKNYKFEPPTENTDGTAINEITEYRLYCSDTNGGAPVGNYKTIPGFSNKGNVTDFPLLEEVDSWCGVTAVYIVEGEDYESVVSNIIPITLEDAMPPKPIPNAPSLLELIAE